jgi:hypothetical protein
MAQNARHLSLKFAQIAIILLRVREIGWCVDINAASMGTPD